MLYNQYLRGALFSLVLSLQFINAFAQKPLNPSVDRGPKSRIELIKADSLIGTAGTTQTRTFFGNVQFRHRGVDLFCQKAVHYAGENNLVAYGKIKVNQGDTLQITGDTLNYYGDSRTAKIFGEKVVLSDDSTTLTSTQINYDINTDLAYYPKPGVVIKDSSTLSSKRGYYNTQAKVFRYYEDVEIINPSYVLCTDSLLFESDTRWAYFDAPTTIKSKDGNLTASGGRYNTLSKLSFFYGASQVENEDYRLKADTLDFNLETSQGYGIGNVEFFSKKDSIFLYGTKGIRDSDAHFTKMIGNTLTKKITGKDTLFLLADSVLLYTDKAYLPKTKLDSITSDSLLLTTTEVTAISDSIQLDTTAIENLTSLETLKKSTEDSTSSHIVKSDSIATEDPNEVQFIIADGNVSIFRSDFQAKCDSLTYDLEDGEIAFYHDPIIWNIDSQLEAEFIRAFMQENKIQQMDLSQRSFVISQDTVGNYNQIKGREIVALFDSTTAISNVNVDGNGESLYFALDDFNKLVALNRVLCAKMRLYFSDKKVDKISFIGRPESKFIPPQEIDQNAIKLDEFNWRIDEKPKRQNFIPPSS